MLIQRPSCLFFSRTEKKVLSKHKTDLKFSRGPFTTGMQKSAINDDSSRWMERGAFHYDFGELAAGKWRGCYGLITRRALGSSPGCPIYFFDNQDPSLC